MRTSAVLLGRGRGRGSALWVWVCGGCWRSGVPKSLCNEPGQALQTTVQNLSFGGGGVLILILSENVGEGGWGLLKR